MIPRQTPEQAKTPAPRETDAPGAPERREIQQVQPVPTPEPPREEHAASAGLRQGDPSADLERRASAGLRQGDPSADLKHPASTAPRQGELTAAPRPGEPPTDFRRRDPSTPGDVRPSALSDWLDSLGEPDWRKTEDRLWRRSRLAVKRARRAYRFRDEIAAERAERKARALRETHPQPPMRPAATAPEIVHRFELPPVPPSVPAYGASAAYPVTESTRLDAPRRWSVTVAAVAGLCGAAAVVGAFGGPDIRSAESIVGSGAFEPDATFLAPSSTAFGIWALIYLGLIGYTIHQWLPSQRTSRRHRVLGWYVAAALILNLLWILAAQQGLLGGTVLVMAGLLATLVLALHWLNKYQSFSRLQVWLVDIPLGLYLGWIIIVSAANLAAWLTAAGWNLLGLGGQVWAIIALAVLTVGGSAASMTGRGRLAVALPIVWGLFWILVQRLWGEPLSPAVAFAAGLGAFLVLVSAGSVRHRVGHAERRALRRQWAATQQESSVPYDDGEAVGRRR